MKNELDRVRETKAVPLVEAVLDGEVTYSLRGVCAHCGKESSGPKDFADIMRLVPSVDSRLRAADLSHRYTVGSIHTLRLEGGVSGTQQAFDVVKSRVRATLPADVAASLISDIVTHLKSL